MIVVTGAAGFIGCRLIHKLNTENFKNIVAVDGFEDVEKNKNLQGLNILLQIDKDDFPKWLDTNGEHVEFIFHMGAISDTTVKDEALVEKYNTGYTKKVWQQCIQYQIPLVYASSAATYGLGEHGYNDDESQVNKLQPLNLYGQSKQDFDVWALAQKEKPFFWAGLKFFNVYGPNEYHKGRMASVVYHTYNQVKTTGKMKLFKSHHPDYKDGEQMRDFVYVEDVVNACYWLMRHRQNSGIYNVGSGKARTFLDLVKAVFKSMKVPESIEFIDTPIDLRDKYQYFTEANMNKLKGIGYDQPFHTLEEGVSDYVKEYLMSPKLFPLKKGGQGVV